MQNDIYLPQEAKVIERRQEAPTIFSLRLQWTDPDLRASYTFQPGQFNMLYLYGVGEIAISIVSDPEHSKEFDHTIRMVGRVTKGFAKLQKGQFIGVRGPFGQGWPMLQAEHQDIVIVTGGLGCAPVISAINYLMLRRHRYGKVIIMQSVKHSDDFIFSERYEQWQRMTNTDVYLAADKAGKGWPWQLGRVTDRIPYLQLQPQNTIALLCGPEIMMQVAAQNLLAKGLSAQNVYLSMERNMACAVGHCGHCQFGGLFICKNGPVLSYAQLQPLLGKRGF